MVAADTTTVPSRYRLLEIMRMYCRTHDPDPDASRAAHAAFTRQQAARGAQELRDERCVQGTRMLTRELPNIRAAIAHDLTASPEAALRTAGELMWFWVHSGLLAEGRRMLERCLDAAPYAPADVVTRARAANAGLEYMAGNGDRAQELIAAVLRTFGAAAHRQRPAVTRGDNRPLRAPVGFVSTVASGYGACAKACWRTTANAASF